MSSLLNNNEVSYTTGIFGNIFDTYCRSIIIYKEPLKTPVVQPQPNGLFGFGQIQAQPLFNYTPVTGVFPALIRYAGRYASQEKEDVLNSDLDAYLGNGPISIKVKGDAKDFIVNGNTEKILIDGVTCILDGKEYRPQFFLTSQYYIFDLQVSK